MQFRRNLRTSIAYNASLRKDTPNDKIYAAAYYVAPLPPAQSVDGTSGVGSTGLWTFDETSDTDGSRLLSLKYRNQQVHTFLVAEAP